MSDGLAAMLPGWGKDIKVPGPLYQRLRLALVEAILSGKLKKGDVLYPERDLAEHVRVSRVTVRKAIDHLVQDGFLVRRRGSGTFVAGSAVRADQPPLSANFLTGDTSRLGSDTKVEWIEHSSSHPAPEEMMTLGLSSDSRVVRITRLRARRASRLRLNAYAFPRSSCPTLGPLPLPSATHSRTQALDPFVRSSALSHLTSKIRTPPRLASRSERLVF